MKDRTRPTLRHLGAVAAMRCRRRSLTTGLLVVRLVLSARDSEGLESPSEANSYGAPMSRSLKLYITGLVGLSAIALLLTSFLYCRVRQPDFVFGMRPDIAIELGLTTDVEVLAGLAFWTLVTLFAGALPVRMPRGTLVQCLDRADPRRDGPWRTCRSRMGRPDRHHRTPRAPWPDPLVRDGGEPRGHGPSGNRRRLVHVTNPSELSTPALIGNRFVASSQRWPARRSSSP